MKRFAAGILNIVLLLILCGCSVRAPAAPAGAGTADTASAGLCLSSVEVYNRTGRLQREDFYDESGKEVSYSVEYSYNDSGLLTAVKKNGGGIGSNAPIETYLYSGDLCTQKVVYDERGATEKITYWKYDKDGTLTEIREVSSRVSGGKTGKTEEIRRFAADGTLSVSLFSSEDDFSKTEYGYDSQGNLITENNYRSSDGKEYLFVESVLREYDGDGRLTRLRNRDAGGTVYLLEALEYDEAGNLVSDCFYSSSQMTEEYRLSQQIREYDEEGRLSFEADYVDSDMVQTYYEYDAEGNVTCVSEKNYSGGKAVSSVVTRTEYDARSNPVRKTVRGPGDSEETEFVREYEYYEDGVVKRINNYRPQL